MRPLETLSRACSIARPRSTWVEVASNSKRERRAGMASGPRRSWCWGSRSEFFIFDLEGSEEEEEEWDDSEAESELLESEWDEKEEGVAG